MASSKIHVENKIFKDPIHGLIEMEPLLVKIIDTPEFQRLRSIKQMGMVYLVYPGASHNRFEHSLGVCHLAGLFLDKLQQQKDPELDIKKEDVLCVKIAGLCHDLGHGPFSHLFDKFAESKVNKENRFRHHEERSRLILKHLIKKHRLETAFEDCDLTEDHRIFIGELITASLERDGSAERSNLGQKEEKQFLFQIVANATSGVDVDKWDYFARDSYMLGFKSDFDHIRCMQLARVIKAGVEGLQICFREKEAFNLYQMFQTRFNLYRRACYHNAVVRLEAMVKDVLDKTDEHMKFEGKTMTEIIESGECDYFCLLTDDILSSICSSTKEDLKDAGILVEKIKQRNLYKRIGEKIWKDSSKIDRWIKQRVDELGDKKTEILKEFIKRENIKGGDEDMEPEVLVEHWIKLQIKRLDEDKHTKVLIEDRIKQQINGIGEREKREILSEHVNEQQIDDLDESEKFEILREYFNNKRIEDLVKEKKTEILCEHLMEQTIEELDDEKKTVVSFLKVDYGKKRLNPIDSVWFYKKGEINKAMHIDKTEVSSMLPAAMSERIIFVYYTGDNKEHVKDLRKTFEDWWSEINDEPNASDSAT